MSKWYERVKEWFDAGVSDKRIRDAVEKGKITAAEYEEITGKPYEAE